MASCETLDQKSPCPCGHGHVSRVVVSPNYPFGRAIFTDLAIQCSTCSPQWEVSADQSHLFHRERYQWPGNAVLQDANKLRSKVMALIHGHQERALLQHLHAKGARSKAAQHRLLTAEKLYCASYQTYLRGGFDSAVSAFDPKQIPECAAPLQQLAFVSAAIDALNKAHRSWLDERRHRVEFALNWQFC